jgi:hypothetical protein
MGRTESDLRGLKASRVGWDRGISTRAKWRFLRSGCRTTRLTRPTLSERRFVATNHRITAATQLPEQVQLTEASRKNAPRPTDRCQGQYASRHLWRPSPKNVHCNIQYVIGTLLPCLVGDRFGKSRRVRTFLIRLKSLDSDGSIRLKSLNYLYIMTNEEKPRLLCPVRLLNGIIAYTCLRCRWTFRSSEDDRKTAQAAFDQHRCEDFPRDRET